MTSSVAGTAQRSARPDLPGTLSCRGAPAISSSMTTAACAVTASATAPVMAEGRGDGRVGARRGGEQHRHGQGRQETPRRRRPADHRIGWLRIGVPGRQFLRLASLPPRRRTLRRALDPCRSSPADAPGSRTRPAERPGRASCRPRPYPRPAAPGAPDGDPSGGAGPRTRPGPRAPAPAWPEAGPAAGPRGRLRRMSGRCRMVPPVPAQAAGVPARDAGTLRRGRRPPGSRAGRRLRSGVR